MHNNYLKDKIIHSTVSWEIFVAKISTVQHCWWGGGTLNTKIVCIVDANAV